MHTQAHGSQGSIQRLCPAHFPPLSLQTDVGVAPQQPSSGLVVNTQTKAIVEWLTERRWRGVGGRCALTFMTRANLDSHMNKHLKEERKQQHGPPRQVRHAAAQRVSGKPLHLPRRRKQPPCGVEIKVQFLTRQRLALMAGGLRVRFLRRLRLHDFFPMN